MKTIHLLVACLLILTAANAHVPGLQWVNKMVGSDSKSFATDPLGNTYFFGNIGLSATLDVDPGPGVYNLNGADGTVIIYKLNTSGQFVWAKQLPFGVTPECIRADAAENVFITGQYSLTKDFDPGPAVFNLTGVGQNDIFILMLDAAGSFLWAKSQGGTQGEIGYSVAISATGTVYTTGYFSGTADFDPGAGIFNMTAGILSDTYISALDPDGNFLWAQHIAGGFNMAHYITTNALGNIIIAGQFSGTKDMNPRAGVFNLTAKGADDIFILKMDALGNFLWAGAVGGASSDGNKAVALDPQGNVYVTGRFKLTADFDPGPAVFNITASGSEDDMFVLKLTPDGNFVWAKQMTGLQGEVGNDIATDAVGNVYTTGFFEDVADFDPGPGVYNLTTNGLRDIFISKLNTDGNFGWAVSFGETTAEDKGIGISVDAAGTVYVTGAFLGQVDFDPGPGQAILINGNTAIFVLKLGASGGPLPVSLGNFSGAVTTTGNALQWQTAQEINTASFDIQWSRDGQHFTNIASFAAAGNSTGNLHYNYLHSLPVAGINYYRLKMIDNDGRFTYSPVVKINVNIFSSGISIYPNPVNDLLKLNLQALKNETILFQLHQADGKVIAKKSFNLINGTNNLNWNVTAIAAGNYFISSGNKNFGTVKICKQ